MNDSQKLNIDLNDVENINCDECKGECFSPTFIIKKMSALVSPSGKEALIPIQMFKCDKCGHINELFLQGLTN